MRFFLLPLVFCSPPLRPSASLSSSSGACEWLLLAERLPSLVADLPLDAMVRAVDRIVHHALGEPMPDALAPDGYWLR